MRASHHTEEGKIAETRQRKLIGAWAAAWIAAQLIAPSSTASQWSVDDDGPADFRSIQEAINSPAVVTGDLLLVKPGTYRGNITLTDKNLVIRSEAGPFVTVLDGQNLGSAVFLQNRSSATVLEGFTITGGRAEDGGGVRIHGGAPVITRNIIQGNTAVGGALGYGYGGGIEVYESAPVITRNVIRGNTAVDGGAGIDAYYAGPSTAGTCCPLISQNTIVGNTVTGAGGIGGGILSTAASPRITSSIVWGNQASFGAGIYAYELPGNEDTPDVTGNIFFANSSGDADSNRGWRLPGSNPHTDPRLGGGTWIDLWPRADSPALDAAEPAAPPARDLAGLAVPFDSDLDGSVVADVGALENRAEITSLTVSRNPGDAAAVLSWDDSRNPEVLFNVYARDGDPFRTGGGTCLAASLPFPGFMDADPLPLRQTRFYLVTGSGVGEGGRGLRSDGTPRPTSPNCSGN